jgi:catechol 2,3-dioxygenase-like lactoylglutathione lyase family enzyme
VLHGYNQEEEMMISKGLQLPKIGQVGVVVKDIQKAVEYYSSVFGIGPFNIYDINPQRAWRNGKEVRPSKVKLAMADFGQVKLELIQLIEGNEDPIHKFLETYGEGLQHLGFYADNYDEWKLYAQEKGMAILYELEVEDEVRGKRRGFFMDSSKIGGVLFEIIEVQKKI